MDWWKRCPVRGRALASRRKGATGRFWQLCLKQFQTCLGVRCLKRLLFTTRLAGWRPYALWYRCSVSFCSICGANRPESASVCMSAIVMSRTKKGKRSQSCYVKKEKRMPAIAISNAGMLSQMRGLELNFGDFELNFGDFDKKREIFRGGRWMPRTLFERRTAPS